MTLSHRQIHLRCLKNRCRLKSLHRLSRDKRAAEVRGPLPAYMKGAGGKQSKECLKRNNYTAQEGTKDVMVSKIPFRIAPVQVFTKTLTRGDYNGR